MKLEELAESYRHMLLDDVVPWWMKHALAPTGAIYTCIADDGQLQSRDCWLWSQWRAVWVFSKLYNAIEPRRQWLDVAERVYQFVTAHGPLDDDHWPLLLDGDGTIQRGYDSIYVDGFAIYGLTELWRATGDDRVLELALQTFRAAKRALDHRLPPPAFPYPVPAGCANHGISMIVSHALFELAQASGDDEVRNESLVHHRRVMYDFLRGDPPLMHEWIGSDGRELDGPEGRVIVPGHAIESMWMQIHIASAWGDADTVSRAVRAVQDHLELGWDPVHGGLYLAVDSEGGTEIAWAHAEKKLWWPHVEALYATLLCYQITGQSWCLDWHEQIRAWSLAHFPVREHGEWRQKLDREGNPITEALFLPVKDPFHLPRGLILSLEVLDAIGKNVPT